MNMRRPCHRRRNPPMGTISAGFICVLLVSLAGRAFAYLDLDEATIETLDNGLTVIVLEEHGAPVVSVQMLYKSGARNEPAGKSGIAHFLEHMAFRASQNFPDTRLVSDIYAAGGEWHGYTWLDQTTYYATVPAPHLDLLLRIEADRMARLVIPVSDIDSERGAVLSEMHGYENDPAVVLQDYVMYLSFVAHPYRNNTIGWQSDIESIGHGDLVEFYERHYQPGNAVLAIVGDVQVGDALKRVRRHFADLPGTAGSPPPHTVEPPQSGERRVRVTAASGDKRFMIAYRAPSVRSPDFPAFLLTQELLSGGSGVSFLQNDWGFPARPGAPLHGICDDLVTWFPPSGQDYVFTIAGSVAPGVGESRVESAIEAGIGDLKDVFETAGKDAEDLLAQARERVLRDLVFDVQTTEDAAHQLAFFTGLDALEVLINLRVALTQVGVADVRRVLARYLAPERRTIGWSVPGRPLTPAPDDTAMVAPRDLAESPRQRNPAGTSSVPRSAPVLRRLRNGTPVVMQRSPLSRTALLRVVVPDAQFVLPEGVRRSEPAKGWVALDYSYLTDGLEQAAGGLRRAVESVQPMAPPVREDASGPQALMDATLDELLDLDDQSQGGASPLILVATGDIQPDRVFEQLDISFSDLPPAARPSPPLNETPLPGFVERRLTYPVAQEQLAYIVRAPRRDAHSALAWRLVLYVLSHGYEGRLGKEAISRRGLVYSIDARHHSDGVNDWITLRTGVDPGKLEAMKALLEREIARLASEPPSQREIEEARAHMLGRFVSEAQSNGELAAAITREWLSKGQLRDYGRLERELGDIGREEILRAAKAFGRGTVVAVRNPANSSQTP